MPTRFTIFFQVNDDYWPAHCSGISKSLVANLVKISRSIVFGLPLLYNLAEVGKASRHWSIWYLRVNHKSKILFGYNMQHRIEFLNRNAFKGEVKHFS